MKKFSLALILALVAIMIFGAISASAFESYDTYTYSIDGEPLMSPTAYTASTIVNSAKMNLMQEKFGGLELNLPTDLVTDYRSNVYIADSGNNRIVVLNKYYSATNILKDYVDENGKAQTFNTPKGVFVTDPNKTADGNSFIYVCDTGNKRIVVFDPDFTYVKTLYCPETPLVDADKFTPKAVAVDIYGRLFVVSEQAFEGIIVLSADGDFTGFIGAQKVTRSLMQKIWRRFQSREQKAMEKTVSIAFNNITVDDEGFIYATLEPEKANQLKAIRSKSADFSPVKKLNSAGSQILNRNGFFDPGGEVAIRDKEDVSIIVDIAVGSEKTWSIVDKSRSRIYTYDQNGNLLFAFGDKGDQLGTGVEFVAMTYHYVDGVYYLIVLDNTGKVGYQITQYAPTEYCDTIMSALHNENEHNYSDSIRFWQDVLTRNNNFDLAYIGIGKALYNQGKYDEAMEMLSAAYETKYWSQAFSNIRRDLLSKWLLPFVALLIALVVLLVKFLGWAKKKNKAVSLKVGRKTYWEELLFAFHLIMHPFDGFWDLKHEYRGSVRGGTTYLVLTVVAFFYQAIGRGYAFNPRGDYSTIFVQLAAVAVPVLLWIVANWCLTTLFDGEGSFKDIYIATTYSLAPLPFFVILSTILTNVLTTSEGSMVNLLVTIGYVWVGFLLFFGTLVTHDYSLGKNVITVLGTIVAMAVIMFVIILFFSLVAKMVTFVIAIVKEINNRA